MTDHPVELAREAAEQAGGVFLTREELRDFLGALVAIVTHQIATGVAAGMGHAQADSVQKAAQAGANLASTVLGTSIDLRITGMPDRVARTEYVRDARGQIVESAQIEADA